MKKTIRYLLSGLALLSLGACTSSDNEDGSGGNDGGLTFVTVVSFNIRVDNAADGDNAWDNRKPASDTDSEATYNGYKTTSAYKLDHIFHSGCTASLFKTLTGNYGAPYISDHYPVKARFILP